jgi:rare lipoprotein A
MRPALMALAGLAGLMLTPALAATDAAAKAEAAKLDAERAKPPPGSRINVDHSGRKESGTATWYGPHRGRNHTASGKRLIAGGHTAASKTLPLGTKAKVTNLKTGKSDVVTIEDRGPFGKGKVIDVTPGVAQKIGLDKKAGVAPVVVAPIAVPQPDGSIKPGAGAAEPPDAPARPDGPAASQEAAK